MAEKRETKEISETIARKPPTEKEILKVQSAEKDFLKNWKTLQRFDESPMETYFKTIDMEFLEGNADKMNSYLVRAMSEDTSYLNQLLMIDFKYRADSKMNAICSCHGLQGSGKSLSMIYLGLLLGKIFSRPFSVKNIVFDPEELDSKLEKSGYRETYLLDEQRQTNVGLMSRTTQLRIADYDDQLRFSQNNLLYASPELRDHSHFFIFKTYKIVRHKNPKCVACVKFKAYDPKLGQRNPCDNCVVLPETRTGYPKAFLLMLYTNNTLQGSFNRLVPRGIVSFPMPNQNIVDEYDKVKGRHIKMLKAKETSAFNRLKELGDKIFERHKDGLVITTKRGALKPASRNMIKLKIYDTVGLRYLTNDGTELLVDIILEKIREHITIEEA